MIDIDYLQTWIGKQRRQQCLIAPFPAAALAAALNREQPPRERLPPMWQWLYFLDTPRADATGADGHPQKGGFLPPVPLPRRMWASGDVELEQPLLIGQQAEKVSTITAVELKAGRSGALVFVTLSHELFQSGARCIREQQHLVYRNQPATLVLPPPAAPPADAQWRERLEPDPVLLFRYSALTYNGHRIHYDRDYAREQERYPALVVQGPLLATMLLETAQRQLPEAPIRRFQFRALRPAFDTDTLYLCGKRDGGELQLWTEDSSGALGMSAQVTLRQTP